MHHIEHRESPHLVNDPHFQQQAMIATGRTYSDADALGWGLDLARALAYLHGRSPQVLHRDVKLSNLLLVKEGSSWVAKLADFGLHKVHTLLPLLLWCNCTDFALHPA